MNYEVIVFDTAPTGHTIRLLGFPQLLETGIQKLIGLKDRFAGIFSQVWRIIFITEESTVCPLCVRLCRGKFTIGCPRDTARPRADTHHSRSTIRGMSYFVRSRKVALHKIWQQITSKQHANPNRRQILFDHFRPLFRMCPASDCSVWHTVFHNHQLITLRQWWNRCTCHKILQCLRHGCSKRTKINGTGWIPVNSRNGSKSCVLMAT